MVKLRGDRLLLLIALLLAQSVSVSNPCSAEDRHVIAPRDSTQWRLVQNLGDLPWSCSVVPHDHGLEGGLWIFTADAPYGVTDVRLQFRADLAEQGIAPAPLSGIDDWSWRWRVANTDSADFVLVAAELEGGGVIYLGASHAIREYTYLNIDGIPTELREFSIRTDDAVDFCVERLGEDYVRPSPETRVTAINLFLRAPHRQEVWLGPISFGKNERVSVPTTAEQPADVAPGTCLLVDLDGDGRIEAVFPGRPGSRLYRPRADGTMEGPLDQARPLGGSSVYHAAAAADLDRDGDPDLVFVNAGHAGVTVLENRFGRFSGRTIPLPRPSSGATVNSIALADDDGDGAVDLLVGYHNVARGLPHLYRAGGREGGFAPVTPLAVENPPGLNGTHSVDWVDLDADGKLDIFTASGGVGLHVYRGRGDGTYGDPLVVDPLIGGDNAGAPVFADVDGDDLIDVFLPMENRVQAAGRTGRNRFYRNLGGLRFLERGQGLGLAGEARTLSAAFCEVDGRPGPELLVLELISGLTAYRFRGAGDSLRAEPFAVSADVETRGLGGAFAVHDLDGDGTPEAIFFRRSDLPVVGRIPGSSGLASVDVARRGRSASSVAVELAGRGWRVPLGSTDRGGMTPVLVAPDDSVFVAGSLDGFRTTAGASVRLEAPPGPRAPGSFAFAARRAWRGAVERLDWTVRRPWFQIGATGVLLVLVASVSTRAARRRMQRSRHESWRALLSKVSHDRHAKWREEIGMFANLARSRAISAGDGRMTPDQLPGADILQQVRQSFELARELGLEGHRNGFRALRALEELRREDRLEAKRLYEIATWLQESLRLIQRPLVEYFRCDARDVFESVKSGRKVVPADRARIVWGDGPRREVESFPMHRADLFPCVEELVWNALKKRPSPSRIAVWTETLPRGSARLVVRDDGAPLAAEKARSERTGSRQGLELLRQSLRPYGGTLSLHDVDGGVEAAMEVRGDELP